MRAGAAQPNMKLTVRERTLTRTKAVYSTTMKVQHDTVIIQPLLFIMPDIVFSQMPGDDEVDEFAGNRHLSQEPKKRPSSAILRYNIINSSRFSSKTCHHMLSSYGYILQEHQRCKANERSYRTVVST